MNSLPLLNSVLGFLMTIPSVGPVLIKVLDIVLAGAALVTPVVGMWRALVALCQGLGKAFPALANFANKISADDAAVEGFVNNTLLPIISDLSLISIPTVSSAAAKAPAAQPAVK